MSSHPGLYKHPKTGTFWIKRRVPIALAGTLGRKTIQETLGTKDRRLAEALFLERMGEISRTWNALTSRQSTLSRRTISGLAGEFYRSVIERHQDDPGEPERWVGELARLEARRRSIGRPNNPHGTLQAEMHDFLVARGFPYSHDNVRPLMAAFAEARDLAYRRLARMAAGDYAPDADATRFAALERPSRSLAKSGVQVLTVADHWDMYVKDTGISLGTQKRFRPILIRAGLYLGTANLANVTTRQIEGWVEHLASTGLAPKTINESCLAAVRAFVSWGITKRLATTNPCTGVSHRGPRTTKLRPSRPQGLTDDEAALILSETLREPDRRVSAEFAAARRWIPWICAYTGARVNEITQLRREDVTSQVVGGETVWVVLVTPEAGSVKNREARVVPLHPHLIEQGFAGFVRGRPPGPLFYQPARARGGSEFNPPYRKVGEKLAAWVRDIGVTDEAVAPNHGWRHRFNTVARQCRMIPEIRDAIVGHAMRTEGEAYGDITAGMMWPEILRLPRFDVDKPTGPREASAIARKRNVARTETAKRAKGRRDPAPVVLAPECPVGSSDDGLDRPAGLRGYGGVDLPDGLLTRRRRAGTTDAAFDKK